MEKLEFFQRITEEASMDAEEFLQVSQLLRIKMEEIQYLDKKGILTIPF